MPEEAITGLYRDRLTDEDPAWRTRVWEVLAERVFQRYVRSSDTVVDIGAGWCEFINAIRCERKIAIDVNPDVKRWAKDAEVILTPATDLAPLADASIDVTFSSNVLEHLPDKAAVLQALRESHRVLKPGGLSITVMPNLRYLYGRYWDYFDHVTPLTHLSLSEAYRMTGFVVERVVPRFTPTVLKSRLLPRSLLLLRLYLRMRFVWWIFGRQMIVVGRKQG